MGHCEETPNTYLVISSKYSNIKKIIIQLTKHVDFVKSKAPIWGADAFPS